MIYCDGCARILDEDVQFCPHCNEEDHGWQPGSIVHEQQNRQRPVVNTVYRGEVFDRLREINKEIAKNPRPEPKPPVYDEKPGPILYMVFLTLASCFSIVGLILGIVYMRKRNKNYQALGIVTLVVSAVFLTFGFIIAAAMLVLGVV